jgi:site-specific DNA-methyltransferase (adenine-specific)
LLPEPYYRESGLTLYCGDCFELLPEMPNCDLVLTDPPYGVGVADWDNYVPSLEWLSVARKLAKIVMVTPGNSNQWIYPNPLWTACWFRPGSVQRAVGAQRFSHWEPILIYGENPMPFDAKEFSANANGQNTGHPSAKPLNLWKWLMGAGCPVGELTIDPFCGSGTTLVAAKEMGREAIGIEKNERYCEIAANRLRQEVLFK